MYVGSYLDEIVCIDDDRRIGDNTTKRNTCFEITYTRDIENSGGKPLT